STRLAVPLALVGVLIVASCTPAHDPYEPWTSCPPRFGSTAFCRGGTFECRYPEGTCTCTGIPMPARGAAPSGPPSVGGLAFQCDTNEQLAQRAAFSARCAREGWLGDASGDLAPPCPASEKDLPSTCSTPGLVCEYGSAGSPLCNTVATCGGILG